MVQTNHYTFLIYLKTVTEIFVKFHALAFNFILYIKKRRFRNYFENTYKYVFKYSFFDYYLPISFSKNFVKNVLLKNTDVCRYFVVTNNRMYFYPVVMTADRATISGRII